MISAIIPTWNAEDTLTETLAALVPGVVDGVLSEAIIVDAGSTDGTAEIVDIAGAQLIESKTEKESRLAIGAARARAPWLLFLGAETVLEPGWEREASAFMERVDHGRRPPSAAVFRYALDAEGFKPRLQEWLAALRWVLMRTPNRAQAILVPRSLLQQIGADRAAAPMTDRDIVRRLGRKRVSMLRTRGVVMPRRPRRTRETAKQP